MTQSTTAIAVAAAKAEVSLNGSSWTSLGPAGISGSPGGHEQHIGAVNVLDGDAPIVTHSNKHGAGTVEIRAVWTPTTAEAWALIRTQWDSSDKTIYFRYSPQGGAGGTKQYTATTDAGAAFLCPIVSCLPPAFDAGSGEAAVFTFSLSVPQWTESTVST